LVGKPEGKGPNRRWVDNIKMDLGVVWTGLVWLSTGTIGELCECGKELCGSIKCWENIEWIHNWWPLE
jgi:hypothetical protein